MYSWCYGIRIVYEGVITGSGKKRGVHAENCRLLTPETTLSLDGWTHYNKDNWAEASDWKNSFYDGYNCYFKYAIGE